MAVSPQKKRRLSLMGSRASVPDPLLSSSSPTHRSSVTASTLLSKTMLIDLPTLPTPTAKCRNNVDESRVNVTSEKETREDDDYFAPQANSMMSSPRTPIAVLKVRKYSSSPPDGDTTPKPFNIEVSSGSLASSMFLVSPLQPINRHQNRESSFSSKQKNSLRSLLIDSSESMMPPLSPLASNSSTTTSAKHTAKRSLKEMYCSSDELKTEGLGHNDSTGRLSSTPANNNGSQKKIQKPTQSQQTPKQRWLIPAEHPYKVLWDVLTCILSIVNVYATHTAIRDRQFGNSWLTTFCEGWFMVDILLNFITEYRSEGNLLADCRSVWARYLTTWFVVDVLSLFPGETLYVRPIITQQNKRGFFKKNFFRTKAVVRVSRILRGRHFKMFGKVAKHSKHAGVGAARLLRLLIKYIPKYLLFFRNMKGVLALRVLRQIHWFRKVWRNFIYKGIADENPYFDLTGDTSLKDYRSDYEDDDDEGTPF